MPRKKITLAYIANGCARTATLKKRRLGLLKKAEELSILCGVPACVVLYAPGESAPTVWPSQDVAMSLFGKLHPNNTMKQGKLHLKQLEKVGAEYSKVITENDNLSGEVLHRGCVSGLTPSSLDFHKLQSVGQAIARRAQKLECGFRKMSGSSGEGVLQISSPPLLVPPLKETAGNDVLEAFDGLENECSWMDGIGEAAQPGFDQPEIHVDDFDPAEWDAFQGLEMEWNPIAPSPTLQNHGPLFSRTTVDDVGFNGLPEIDEGLQDQWCWKGLEGGDDVHLKDIGGITADMFTPESEQDIGTSNSFTWDEFFDSF